MDLSQQAENTNLSDSGYASLANSPDRKDTNDRDLPHVSNSRQPREPPKAATSSFLGGLKRFEKDVDKATLDRFQDVLERVQSPLIQYMRKRYGPRDIQPMAIRLIVLGETYDDARPHVVVLCSEDKTKRVKKFFAQRSITFICRPNDPLQVSFNVTIIGQPPRPKNGGPTVEVYGVSNISDPVGWTTSSTLVRVTGEDGDRYATMGGVIKIEKTDGDFVLCGITAGHIVEEIDERDMNGEISTLPELSSSSDASSDEESDGDEEMPLADTTTDCLNAARNATILASVKFGTSWSKVGAITAKGRPVEARNRDWALVEDIDKIFQRTNTIQKCRDEFARPARPITLVKERAIGKDCSTRVLILTSGSLSCGNSQSGLLSNLPAVALLPSGTKFVPVYTIALDDESDLPNGSSGSWVIDDCSDEVYGHVVADDAFGDVFVVPFTDIFDDIKRAAGAKAVTLPSDIDILSQLSRDTRISESTSRFRTIPMAANKVIQASHEQTSTRSHSATSNTIVISASSLGGRLPLGTWSSEDPLLVSSAGSIVTGGLPTPRTTPSNSTSTSPQTPEIGNSTTNPSSQVASITHSGSTSSTFDRSATRNSLRDFELPTSPPNPPEYPARAFQHVPYPPITRASSSSPNINSTMLGNVIGGYFRSSSPLNNLFSPFRGCASAPSEWFADHRSTSFLPPSSTIQSYGSGGADSSASSRHGPTLSNVNGPKSPQPYQRPYRYYPSSASVLSNVNNPNGQLSLVNNVPGMMPVFNSGQMPHFTGYRNPQPAANERPFRCDQCVQSFNRNHDLKRHKRIHLAVKPFPCNHCDRSFSRKDALKRHILVKGCGKEATDNNEIAENRETGEKGPESDDVATSSSNTRVSQNTDSTITDRTPAAKDDFTSISYARGTRDTDATTLQKAAAGPPPLELGSTHFTSVPRLLVDRTPFHSC